MHLEGSPDLESRQALWARLDQILDKTRDTHELIDDGLRDFLAVTTEAQHDVLDDESDITRCCYRLLNAPLFRDNAAYVRRQIIFCLLQEDDVSILHTCAALLLLDGRTHEPTYEMMQDEGAFPCLIELIRHKRDDDLGLHRLLLELLYEMSRVQKVDHDEILIADDAFVLYLLDLIEQLSDDANDPYHYPIIRVLLVLNEQYMCLANEVAPPNSRPVTNRILKLLSTYGSRYRTFGENLILLLNRESTLTSQLLILKLLYLLFTTPSTFEYFYTNDLNVLVDVIIRNILDLDPGDDDGEKPDQREKSGQRVLRHTYLRVLCPLLKNTQLNRAENHYKRDELRKVLYLLVHRSSAHFEPVDQTVLRLVIRCRQIDWLREEGDEQDAELEEKLASFAPSDSDMAKKLLGMSIEQANESNLSIPDVSAKIAKEKPAVPAPRRAGRRTVSAVESASAGTVEPLQPPIPRIHSNPEVLGMKPGNRSPFADDTENK